MKDLLFDINDRDLVIENGDFLIIDNPSVQNGSILKEARAFSPLFPVWGVGLMESINSPVDVMTFEMNRWSAQAKLDGATIARFTITNKDSITNVDIQVDYGI